MKARATKGGGDGSSRKLGIHMPRRLREAARQHEIDALAVEQEMDAALDAAGGDPIAALFDEPPRHEQPVSPAQRLLAGLCGEGQVPQAPATAPGRRPC